MIVLDTNVVSQMLRPSGSSAVLAWVDRQPFSSLRIAAVSVMEIRLGVEMLPDGGKKARYAAEWAALFKEALAERTLPFDANAADIAGRLSAQRRRRGIVVDANDTMIAAIAIAHNAAIATRNVLHFPDLPVDVIDPWIA